MYTASRTFAKVSGESCRPPLPPMLSGCFEMSSRPTDNVPVQDVTHRIFESQCPSSHARSCFVKCVIETCSPQIIGNPNRYTFVPGCLQPWYRYFLPDLPIFFHHKNSPHSFLDQLPKKMLDLPTQKPQYSCHFTQFSVKCIIFWGFSTTRPCFLVLSAPSFSSHH